MHELVHKRYTLILGHRLSNLFLNSYITNNISHHTHTFLMMKYCMYSILFVLQD